MNRTTCDIPSGGAARRGSLGAMASHAFAVLVDAGRSQETVLRVRGELDLATQPRLTAALTAHLPATAASTLRIDLSAVTFTGVGPLRAVLDIVDDARSRGLDVGVVNESPTVLALLALVDLPAPRCATADRGGGPG